MLRIYVWESIKDPLEISEVVHAGGRWTQVRHIHYVPGFLSHQPPIIERYCMFTIAVCYYSKFNYLAQYATKRVQRHKYHQTVQ